MWANNEVGVVQPIEAISFLCAEHGVPLHVDAVQAVGSVEVDAALPRRWPPPRTSWAGRRVWVRWSPAADVALAPLAHGGGQERKVRSGTFNVAGIAAFAAAVEYAAGRPCPSGPQRIGALRDGLIGDVRAVVPGRAGQRRAGRSGRARCRAMPTSASRARTARRC